MKITGAAKVDKQSAYSNLDRVEKVGRGEDANPFSHQRVVVGLCFFKTCLFMFRPVPESNGSVRFGSVRFGSVRPVRFGQFGSASSVRPVQFGQFSSVSYSFLGRSRRPRAC